MSQNNTTEVNSQILRDIQSLQDLEKNLLNDLATKTNLTTSQQQELVTKIADVSNLRINLYSTLHGINYNFTTDVKNTRDTLSDQLVTIQIVEGELMEAQKKLGILEQEKEDKLRLLEINDYYGEKFGQQKTFMAIFVLELVVVLLLVVLYTRGIVGKTIFYSGIVVVGIISLFTLGRIGYNMFRRSKMDYQKYDFSFNASDASKALTSSSSSSADPWAKDGICIGSACCSEQETYDPSIQRCVSIASNPKLPILNYKSK